MKKQENNTIYLLKRDDLIKVLDKMIKRDFKNVDRDSVKKIADIINYYVDWKKRYQKRYNIIFEIKEVLRYFFYLECKYNDAFQNNFKDKDDEKEKILSQMYWDLANILYILIREKWPARIPISDEEAPYDYIIAVRTLSNMEVNIDLPKSRYILKDYLTYVSSIWGIKYSDHYGLVQFLFFKFRDESVNFCRQMATEIVSLLQSTGYKKDKDLLDRIKIFDSDEGIVRPSEEDYKYRSTGGSMYSVDSKILNAVDRIAEQQFINNVSYQEQEIARINLLIRESYI